MFNKMIPLLPPNGNRDLTCDLKGDFKNSVRVEKFRIGEKAVYIPAGFSWKYLLKEDILSVRKCKWLIRSENGVAPWAIEAPALRLAHAGGETILELEKEKNAQKALALINRP
jgi:hypothetical protein